MGGGQVALVLNDQECSGRSQLIFLLLGLQGLLRQNLSAIGGGDLREILLQRDLGVAHAQENLVLDLTVLHLQLAFIEQRAGVIGLGGTDVYKRQTTR